MHNQEAEYIQMQINATQKVASVNSRKHSQKTYAKREDRQSLV